MAPLFTKSFPVRTASGLGRHDTIPNTKVFMDHFFNNAKFRAPSLEPRAFMYPSLTKNKSAVD